MARKAKQFTVTDGKIVLKLELVEEGGYLVTAPFDPTILTQAESVEEAFENAYDVIALYEADRKKLPNRRKKAAVG